ncbi:hypothetical protein [Sphingobium phenoxybenzoativorans]|uniref:hypothetical protein n=1 Tax=Sphingobium phenoxybenzoativorans TaxID=1592790 RepID=UPI00087211A5|nr:hypothetical protein [Sphingobium phenoxybenzoativorans]
MNIGTRLNKLEQQSGDDDAEKRRQATMEFLRNAIGPGPRPVLTPEEQAEVDRWIAAMLAAIANEGRKDD